VRNCNIWNVAAICKLVWSVYSKKDSIWVGEVGKRDLYKRERVLGLCGLN